MHLSMVMPNLFTWDGDRLVTGGLERFALQLIDLAASLGYEVEVHQNADHNWRRSVQGVPVHGHGLARISPLAALEEIHQSTGHCLYLSILQQPSVLRPDSIVVSHGVWWDAPGTPVQDHLQICRDALTQATEVISVDYNFLNVMRAVLPDLAGKIRVIPNSVDLSEFRPPRRRSGPATVLFPRRLDPARGADLFLAAMAPILEDDQGVRVLMAVDRNFPDRVAELEARLGQSPFAGRVELTPASFAEMAALYRQADIAVIPSLYSEGTSLACLEAMASGCAVVASDVGGLTNLVLSGHNGVLVRPEAKELEAAVRRLLVDPDGRRALRRHAAQSAAAFSLPRWRTAWAEALKRVYGAP